MRKHGSLPVRVQSGRCQIVLAASTNSPRLVGNVLCVGAGSRCSVFVKSTSRESALRVFLASSDSTGEGMKEFLRSSGLLVLSLTVSSHLRRCATIRRIREICFARGKRSYCCSMSFFFPSSFLSSFVSSLRNCRVYFLFILFLLLRVRKARYRRNEERTKNFYENILTNRILKETIFRTIPLIAVPSQPFLSNDPS